MEFVTPIVTPIVESLMVRVMKHVGFFLSSTKHVRKMSERLQDLNQTKDEIEEKKKDAFRNDRLIPDRVSGWLEQVETLKREAANIPVGGNGCLNPKIRYKAGKRSFDILEKIDKLVEKQKEIEWDDKQRPLGMVISPSGPSTSETVHDHDITQNMFPSRISLFNLVLNLLEADSNTQMIGLWGMGGLGKTTMMEDLKKVAEKRRMFQYVVKVDIGRKYDSFTTQKHIAHHIGQPLTEETEKNRAERLQKIFEGISKTDQKILFILDDVWEAINLEDIGLTSPFPKGFKLLTTSRNEKVCIKMDIETSSIFRMGHLEETEANNLFWKTTSYSDGDDELHAIGEDILKKCRGLPIAIKTIANALKGEEKGEWKAVQKKLQRHNLKGIEHLEDVVNKIFEISYNYLKKDEDKTIFVLCGLFPDDFDIVVEDLMRYGWGLQFFNKDDSLVEARNQTNTSVSNLIRGNLLTESSDVGCVKMHDLARDFVLSNTSKFKQASIVNHGDKREWPTRDTRASCERLLLSCQGMYELPQDFNYPNLALLKLMNGDELRKFPKDFHNRLKKLEVMACDEMLHPLHLVRLQCFSGLRTLCLNSCSLVNDDISFLGDLVNLEVLSLGQCKIQKLPYALAKLKRLKLLDMAGCVNFCIDDGVFQNMENLEELYLSVVYNYPIRFTDANCVELKNLSEKLNALELEFFKNTLQPKNVSFEKLERFRISIGCALESKYPDVYSFKNTLHLVTNKSDLLESKIYELFSKTQELRVSVKDMIYVEDIIMSPSQNSIFSDLRVLHVIDCPNLTHMFTVAMANGMKQLESLTISSCPILQSLVSLSNSVNSMELPKLAELELSDLPNFTSIIPATQTLFNKKVVFPKLSKMRINGLKKLTQIWACHITSGEEDNVSMLREIKVLGCDNLANIFPRNPMRLLSHLEELIVQDCCSIEVLFNIDLGKLEQHRSNSNLRRIKCYNLKELTEVWRINEESNSGELIRGFQNVEKIMISRCMEFKNLFTPTTVNFAIGALTDIDISSDSRYGEIKDDGYISIVAYPWHTFHHLRNIRFQGFKGQEVMFEMECPSINRDLVTTQQQQTLPLFPCLEELELGKMDTLSHVWKCDNWKRFFILHEHQSQSSFQNLTTIRLSYCKNIKYLFSPLMSKLLSSLKTIKIKYCEGMEEVVSSRDNDEEDEVLSTSTTSFFPCLDFIELCDLDNLKEIGGVLASRKTNVNHDQFKFSQVGVVPWSLCQYSRWMYINNCHALSSVIPYYAAAQMQKLEKLSIINCKLMVEVFETKGINNNGGANFDHGSPKSITMRHELTNLKTLKIRNCDLLEYVFTFSILESLKNLEKLSIHDCKGMKVIVREENREESCKVVLPRLKSIELQNLPDLVGFFMGKNVDLECSSLDYVMIKHCPQLIVFTPRASNLKYIHTWLGKHNIEFHWPPSPNSSLCPTIAQGTPWSFHNLIQMKFMYNHELKNLVPSNEFPHLQYLENIYAARCRNVEEVFEVAPELTNNESQSVVLFPKLKEVEVSRLDNLKHIWKNNQWRRLEFPHLTRLHIYGCNSLEYVFTPSMAGALMQLQMIEIIFCDHMEVIMKKEECDGKVNEIKLPCLKSLTLRGLPRFKGVYLGKENLTLSSLDTLVIEECSEIRVFNEGRLIAPMLKLVEAGIVLFRVGEDINSFIMTKRQEACFGENAPSDDDENTTSEDK